MASVKRIVFVDDDERLLDGLRLALRRHRNEWDMEFVGGGEQALVVMDAQPVDVVVTDMGMPGMNGADLLAHVREQHPNAVRLILSGQSSQGAVLRAANVTHQFLSKPIDTLALEHVLTRALALQDRFANDALRSVITGLQALPSLPHMYSELTACASREDINLRRVAEVVKQDVGICAKVLQIANSALFGVAQQTTSVEQAVVYLGLNVIKSLALTMSLYREIPGPSNVTGFDLRREQGHALAVAQLARLISGTKVNPDTAFTAGVLHDVGKVVFAVGQPDTLKEAMARARAEGRHLHEVERELCAVDHAMLGAHLLGLWGLPQQVVEGVAYHHDPLRAPNPAYDTITTVHVADALVREREAHVRGCPFDMPTEWVVSEYVHMLGIEDRLPMWRTAAAGLVHL